jgi:hypothetical protein
MNVGLELDSMKLDALMFKGVEYKFTKGITAIDEDLINAGFNVGYVGIVGLPDGIKFVIDSEIKNCNTVMVAGANEDNFHCGMMIDEEGASVGQMVGKFPHVEGGRFLFEEFGHFADLIAVQEGDICACRDWWGWNFYRSKNFCSGV